MKTQKNSKLEKILSSAKQTIETIKGAGARAREIAGSIAHSTVKFFKDNYRVGVMIGAGVLGGYGLSNGNAEADQLLINFKNKIPGVTKSSMSIIHEQGATENYDSSFDTTFNESIAPAQDIYSLVSFNPFKLSTDARPPESITTINAEIAGRGLSSPINNELQFGIYDPHEENNFLNKNIFADLYNVSTGILQGTYNVKDYANNGWTVSITISNGLSYTMDVRFEPAKSGDFNVDGNVDILDLEVFAGNWLNDNCSSPDNYCNFTDMNKDTNVNFEDFAVLASAWLTE